MLTGQILLQLIVILSIVQVFGYLCRLIGQQRVIGEILAGLALGETIPIRGQTTCLVHGALLGRNKKERMLFLASVRFAPEMEWSSMRVRCKPKS